MSGFKVFWSPKPITYSVHKSVAILAGLWSGCVGMGNSLSPEANTNAFRKRCSKVISNVSMSDFPGKKYNIAINGHGNQTELIHFWGPCK